MMNLASENDKSENFLIDFIISSALGILLAYLTYENFIFGIFIYYAVRFFYYFSFEMIFGRTLAKFQTQTKVVNEKGEKPTTMNLLIRNITRFWIGLSLIIDDKQILNENSQYTFVIKDTELRKFEIKNILRVLIELTCIGFIAYIFINEKNKTLIDYFMVGIFGLLLFDVLRVLIKYYKNYS